MSGVLAYVVMIPREYSQSIWECFAIPYSSMRGIGIVKGGADKYKLGLLHDPTIPTN